MQKVLSQYIADGYSIITPTQRLSRYLSYCYNQAQIQNGLSAWRSAEIITWDVFVQELWTSIQFNTQHTSCVINPVQQMQLWKEVIQKSSYANDLMQLNATVKQVMQSYELCHEWRIPIFPENTYLVEDSFAFKTWVEAYKNTLTKNNYIDTVSLPDRIIEYYKNNKSEKKLLIYGFDEISARQQAVFDCLSDSGSKVIVPKTKVINQASYSFTATDQLNEIRSCANWVKQLLKKEDGSTIGVVVPNLYEMKDELRLIFNKVLQAENISSQTDYLPVYNISLGEPLYEYPIINHALLFLSLNKNMIDFSSISLLLHSPFFKFSETFCSQQAQLEKQLRNYAGQNFTIKHLRSLSEFLSEEKKSCNNWINTLKEYEIFCLSHARTKTYADWAVFFTELLSLGGWPGQRSLNSAEQQSLDTWHKVLTEFASLDQFMPVCDFATALSTLRQLTQQKHFQPETEEVRVQITGIAAASAMQFDHVWVMSSDDSNWPQATKADAFIPVSLQREYELNDISVDKKLVLSQKLLQALKDNSRSIVYSYAAQQMDQLCRLSPLITGLVTDEYQLDIEPVYEEVLQQTAIGQLETFIDDTVNAVPDGVLLKGGAAIFKSQSACPFQAFAKYRLNAEGLPTKEPGLDAAERGELLHKVLQYIWQRLRNLKTLQDMSETDLSALIESVVAEVITQLSKRSQLNKQDVFLQIEQQRLRNLCLAWLELEKQRPDFRVVMTEEWQIIIFNDFELRFRLDRVDELENGQRIIVDYKTGYCSPTQWIGERPDDPQLPLYAISLPDPVAGLLFAKIKTGEMDLKGLVESESLFADKKQFRSIKVPELDWQETLEEWRTNLHKLADEYKNGYVAVAPRDNEACRYCDLNSFCRIGERVSSLLEEQS